MVRHLQTKNWRNGLLEKEVFEGILQYNLCDKQITTVLYYVLIKHKKHLKSSEASKKCDRDLLSSFLLSVVGALVGGLHATNKVLSFPPKAPNKEDENL